MRSTCMVPDEDDSDEVDSSSMGGVIGRDGSAGDKLRMGVSERDRASEGDADGGFTGGDGRTCRTVWDDVLELLPLRVDRLDDLRGEDDTDVDGRGGERLT